MCRLALQTILWGERVDNLEDIFRITRDLGFQGLELAQVPRYLDSLSLPEERDKALEVVAGRVSSLSKTYGIQIIGLAGGPLNEREVFSEKLAVSPLYTYTDSLADLSSHEPVPGPPLALHPHMFKSIESHTDAVALLQEKDWLSFLPDTAHMFLGGMNECDILKALKKWEKRLAAVHLKDWNPRYGWSRPTYARGFCELGEGVIDLDSIWHWLRDEYQGWVVIEQDCSEVSPAESLATSVAWLYPEESVKHYLAPISKYLSPSPILQTAPPTYSVAVNTVLRAAKGDIERLYMGIAKAACEWLGGVCSSVWEISNRNGTMAMHSFWPIEGVGPEIPILQLDDTLCAAAVSQRRPLLTEDLRQCVLDKSFLDEQLVETYGAARMLSIPIVNSFNITVVELILNVFLPDGTGMPEPEPLLTEFAKLISQLVGTAWIALRSYTMETLSFHLRDASTTASILKRTRELLTDDFCYGVSSFLLDPLEKRLVLRDTSGLDSKKETKRGKVTYGYGEGIPGKCWERKDKINLADYSLEMESDCNAWEEVPEDSFGILATPIHRFPHHRDIIGVIRCRGRMISEGGVHLPFSASDEIRIDGVQTTLCQPLDRLTASERRVVSLRCVSHELRVPIMMIKGASQRVEETGVDLFRLTGRSDRIVKKSLKTALAVSRDILGYADLMDLYVDNLSVLRVENAIGMKLERVVLLQDILLPMVKQVGFLLKQRKFSSDSIFSRGFSRIPGLFVDRRRFLQVFFNLIGNSVKYSYDDPEKFKIEIIGHPASGGNRVIFRDWGTGIEEGTEESIFEEGFRGRNAREYNVTGDGLGLWLVARILREHGASIRVTHYGDPTEFTMDLPPGMEIPPAARESAKKKKGE
jgi:signal transduction histidine kinase/sugar phosphate isomerase/epimerase